MLALAFVCLLAVGLLAAFQRSLLYHPTLVDAQAVRREASRASLRVWPSRGDAPWRGLVAEPTGTPARGTIAVLHGNAGSSWERAWYRDVLSPLGYRVVLLEHPGYGGRPGALSEASLVGDAARSLRLLADEFGHPLYVLGESLGAGVAAGAVRDCDAPIAGVMLVTPWDELATPAQAMLPALPVRWLLADRYDSVAALRRYQGPLAVVVAERDGVIPPASGHALYERFHGTKRRWVVRGAEHNDWMNAVDAAWWGEVLGFLETPQR